MMRRIDPKKFRERLVRYDSGCPFCTNKVEMFCAHDCPACGSTRRIDPQPREDLEEIAGAFRAALAGAD